MQGIILAAGMGKRLKDLTNDNTKCMVKVNGVTMIERALRILDKKNLTKVVIVVGYKGQKLIDFINTLDIKTPIEFIDNPIYDKTNNIYSLALAKDYLCSDSTLLLESDLVFEESVIDALIDDPRENLALVDKFESWMDGTCMELDENDCISSFIPGKHLKFSDKEQYYKTVNIYKFSREFSENVYVPLLGAYEKAMGENEYYESVIKLIAVLDSKILQAKRLNGQIWYEIDNVQDLNIAESLFADNEADHYKKLMQRYGGYWRYPKLLDFCYLVNPYYPPAKMKEEMKSNFDTLLTEYPSGMYVNSLLVSGAFGVKQEHIVVGNGAAELIKGIIEAFAEDEECKLGCIYPTFQEYPNRFKADRIVPFKPHREGFRYTAQDLIDFYSDNRVGALVLINPDNPSGNYIPTEDVIRLIDWCKDNSVKLIVDESFVDFARLNDGDKTADHTLIKEDILNRYDKLYVMKSISKSYGIPGVRLGVLASSDSEMISMLKKDVSIWNINSFAEFYLQIKEKYDKDYEKGLVKIRETRERFVKNLSEIDYMTVYPSEANYVCCKLEGIKASVLCEKLLSKNILIKELTSKIDDGNEYIRIAVRNDADNDYLVDALKNINR